MSNQTVDQLDADELEVKEVRCSVTGIPISTIPNWYAHVNVNFVSDHARSKSGAAARDRYLPIDVDSGDDSDDDSSESNEISLDDIDEGITVDDIEDIDLGEDLDDADTDDAEI